ncbi:hypothetical protein HNR31_003312 [Anoxybacillus caldiproteolyticus]|uniref:Uncharacterized protein n=1 Tax=Thermaerobacillus caldiproteolyticus TaxID=247480 RepID=A0A7V9Z9K8_9BACL|nr:hypothetical protein [Anoxybacillus caldiproteolyticus]
METKSSEEELTRKIVVKLEIKEGKDIEMSFLYGDMKNLGL